MNKLNITILTFVIVPLFACNSGQKIPDTDILKSTQSPEVRSEFMATFDHYEVIRPLKQPKTMDCWATALTILYSWKYNDNTIKIEDVVRKYGNNYLILFQTNAGIKRTEELELYSTAKMNVI